MKTFPLTQAHIDAAIRHDCKSCPIALALREAGYSTAEVFNWTWYASESPAGESGALDTAAVNFVADYDCADPVKPGILSIDTSNILHYEAQK